MISIIFVFSAGLASLLAMPAAALGQEQGAIARVEVRRHLAVATACPDVFIKLPELLYSAWRDFDTPVKVMVDFKLDGDRVADVKISGGYRNHYAPIRHAVRGLKCHSPGAGSYAVRFQIVFAYPEDEGQALALQVISTDRAVASLDEAGLPDR